MSLREALGNMPEGRPKETTKEEIEEEEKLFFELPRKVCTTLSMYLSI
jgi:hypothetical protein